MSRPLPSSAQKNVESGSLEVKWKSAIVEMVEPLGPAVIVVSGGWLSIVTGSEFSSGPSVSTTMRPGPSGTVLVSNVTPNGGSMSVPRSVVAPPAVTYENRADSTPGKGAIRTETSPLSVELEAGAAKRSSGAQSGKPFRLSWVTRASGPPSAPIVARSKSGRPNAVVTNAIRSPLGDHDGSAL